MIGHNLFNTYYLSKRQDIFLMLTRIELIEIFGGWFYGMLLPKILSKNNSDIITNQYY